jgi:hypothetical protein
VRERENEVTDGRVRYDDVVLILDQSSKENADRMVTGGLTGLVLSLRQKRSSC